MAGPSAAGGTVVKVAATGGTPVPLAAGPNQQYKVRPEQLDAAITPVIKAHLDQWYFALDLEFDDVAALQLTPELEPATRANRARADYLARIERLAIRDVREDRRPLVLHCPARFVFGQISPDASLCGFGSMGMMRMAAHSLFAVS